ncbi:MAG: hypothetical protein ACTHK2_10365 [Dokdonella sp.]|uniref:hypothetical protein n=1 Tax=Dokdonella sp. TaxID=2291710 RepID=UPI003F7EF36C
MRPTRTRIALTLLAPFVLLLGIESTFHARLWERHAQPASHAGTSARLKRALRDPVARRIDFVTLGSSRPEYGIDHAAWAARATERGLVHADLSMPGTHWMTIGVLARWLEREHPEIRGGVIGMSVQDFSGPGNGAYELGIVQPFRTLADTPWIAQHVRFDLHDLSTWGVYSSMAQWRGDLREYLRDPSARRNSIRWYRQNRPAQQMLFGNPESHGDMCGSGLASLAACDALDASTDDASAGLRRQCAELRGQAASRADYGRWLRDADVPAPLQQARDLVRGQLRAITWPEPPVVLLMPMPALWARDVLGASQHAWALHVLQPLVDTGRIRVLDATDLFAGDPGECGDFFDFYHQNATGRERLDAWLQPRLAPLLGAAPTAAGTR